ncbi:MAG: hypothetical protein CSH36_08980 [Thalassolituus sp.]|nr:MAG: hypothetical protein CSH36_08980 [Thalassolituus sp.]
MFGPEVKEALEGILTLAVPLRYTGHNDVKLDGNSTMKMLKTLAVGLISAVISLSALGADPAGETVTIRNDGDNTYYEFRVNGEIVEIKVQPKVGPAYYLTPTQAEDQEFERTDVPNMRVPKWVLFRW